MPLPRPVPPPVMRTRLFCRRSVRNIRGLRSRTEDYTRPLLGVGVRGRGALATAGGTPALRVASYAEAVVGVVEFWRDAGTGATAGHFDLVAPGASAGGLALRLHRGLIGAARVAFGRDGVVVGVVPVAAPFMDVVANVVQAESVGGVASDRLGAGLPACGVVGEGLRRVVTPWEVFLFQAAAGGVLPFGFGRQAVGAGGLRAQPFAVAGGFMPRDGGHGLLGMVEVWILPERRRRGAGRGEEVRVFGVGDLGRG